MAGLVSMEFPVEDDSIPRAPPTSSIPQSLSPPPRVQPRGGPVSEGEQSEQRLPCKTEVITCADGISQSVASMEPTAQRQNSTASASSSFHILLQQLEVQHCREIAMTRAELESEVAGLREQLQFMSERDRQYESEAKDSVVQSAPSDGLEETEGTRRKPDPRTGKNITNNSIFRPLSETNSRSQFIDLNRIGSGLAPKKESIVSKIISKVRSSRERSTSDRSDRSKTEQVLCELVQSQAFDGVCAVMIVVNAVLLGIATDIAAREFNPDNLPGFFTYTDRIFTGWFLLEVCLRMFAEGACNFFFGKNGKWNVFDFVVVTTDLIETSAAYFSGDNSSLLNLTAIRMLRVLRIVRAVRVIRLVRFFKELRMMVFSVLRSGLSLLWSIILLAIIIFIFSIYLTQQVTYYVHENSESSDEIIFTLKGYFGSLTFAAYMLFQCISGGISWGEIGGPLLEIHWTNGLVLCFFVFFAVFAVLNIITGIFVDTAFSSAQADRDAVIQEAIHSEKSTLREMQRFFSKADVDQSGTITCQELDKQLQDRRVRAHFGMLGIEATDAKGIFRLLDIDKSGEVDIEEFVFGCLRMKGNARSVDVLTLIHENRRLKAQITKFATYVKDNFDRQGDFYAKMESFIQPCFKSAAYKEAAEGSLALRSCHHPTTGVHLGQPTSLA